MNVFLYIGGQGQVNSLFKHNQCLKGGWNGGGDACSYELQSSGGGSTDVRLTNNENYHKSITGMYAGGGGGDGDGLNYHKSITGMYAGGKGGGLTGGTAYGFSGQFGIPYGTLSAHGGTQDKGGEAVIKKGNFENQNGGFGYGGKCAGGNSYCGGGGGGYFGGGGGFDVTGGGGGSGYSDPSYFKFSTITQSEHRGNGIIFITALSLSGVTSSCKQSTSLTCIYLFLLL